LKQRETEAQNRGKQVDFEEILKSLMFGYLELLPDIERVERHQESNTLAISSRVGRGSSSLPAAVLRHTSA
jgi:hypothetical protein